MRLIPPRILAECHERARTLTDRPVNRTAAVAVVAVWVALTALAVSLVARR